MVLILIEMSNNFMLSLIIVVERKFVMFCGWVLFYIDLEFVN